jgi:hypothetical protein
VLKRDVDRSTPGKPRWICRCACGTERSVCQWHLTHASNSCGCYNREQSSKAHKLDERTVDLPEYKIWSGIVQRCTNPKRENYPKYGGRGIKLCERWRVFANFYADMGARPSPDHSIDRTDTDGDYAPENCRWATSKEQANNGRHNRWIELNGERKTMKQWSEHLGINYYTLADRIRRGWPPEKALS